jgi:hypothetical protein
MKAVVVKNFLEKGTKEAHLVGDTINFDESRVASLEALGFVRRVVASTKGAGATSAPSEAKASESKTAAKKE